MEYKFSTESKKKVISFLREYIELCLKHKTIVTGIIGAETAIWIMQGDREDHRYVTDEVTGNAREIIQNLYDDSGNLVSTKEDVIYIYDQVKDLLE